jgi:hypothetical protein
MKRQLSLALAFLGLLVAVNGVKAAVLKVDDDHEQCPDATYTNINSAVAAASAGDTIKVCPGTYNETVDITKTLTLDGAGPDPKARTGDSTKEAIVTGVTFYGFSVQANGVVIDGFTFQGTSGGPGVFTGAGFSGYVIRKNLFRDNVFGLYFNSNGASKSFARENVFSANNRSGAAGGNGIYSDAGLKNALIEHNSFSLHESSGIVLTSVGLGGVDTVSISHNTSKEDSSFIAIFNSVSTEIDHNDVSKSTGSAIFVGGDNNGLVVSHNDLSDGDARGIRFNGPAFGGGTNLNVEVSHNQVKNFVSSGIAVAPGSLMTSKITQNHSNNNGQDGIFIEAGGNSGNFITDNEMMKNVRFDAHDDTTGGGTAGTANYWAKNKCKTSSPTGLCK